MSTHNICYFREIRKILCGYSLLSVAMLIIMGVNGPFSTSLSRPYVRKMNSIQYLLKRICVLDSYFIHRYIIIKYRSSLI